jgi:hypothetical protein
VDVVGAALEHERGRPIGEDERRQEGLEHQARASGRADCEAVLAGLHIAGNEGQLRGPDRELLALGAADLTRRLDRGDVLAHHPGARAVGADLLDPEGLAGDERQRERGAEHLPSTFALGAVDHDHFQFLMVAVIARSAATKQSSGLRRP